jgi:myo-inositol-1(or 4)-monophosphatase
MSSQKPYLKIAIKAAKEAGKIHLKYFNTALKIKTKSCHRDRLTKADLESEKKIVSTIRKAYPDHNILAEENHYKKTGSDYTWIIDPLDGTNNFSHNLPIFCTSIALARKDDLIAAAIYDPIRKELFTAEKGRGAFLNGKRISVTKTSNLKDSLLVTGFYYDRGKPMLQTVENIRRFLLKKVLGIRRLGSAALDLCNVACGRMDGFWEFFLNTWDFAAGMLLIEEAGGRVTGKKGKKKGLKSGFIVASNKKIHSKMLKVIK